MNLENNTAGMLSEYDEKNPLALAIDESQKIRIDDFVILVLAYLDESTHSGARKECMEVGHSYFVTRYDISKGIVEQLLLNINMIK